MNKEQIEQQTILGVCTNCIYSEFSDGIIGYCTVNGVIPETSNAVVWYPLPIMKDFGCTKLKKT